LIIDSISWASIGIPADLLRCSNHGQIARP
jgi:hypothetical protein